MRIDKYFAEKYGSRTKAERAIMSGIVLVNGKAVSPSYEIKENDLITFKQVNSSFVSMGGFKLEKALNDFLLNVEGKIFVDIGASTGGFTDCLFQHGAKKVYCVDVGESLLDKSLINKNIVVIDNFNARNLAPELFDDRLDGAVADLSFISLTYIIPAAANCLPDNAVAVFLIKPQFELDKSCIGKNGIVKEKNLKVAAIKRVYDCAVQNLLAPIKLTEAPVRNKKNIEYPVMLVKRGNPAPLEELLKCANL